MMKCLSEVKTERNKGFNLIVKLKLKIVINQCKLGSIRDNRTRRAIVQTSVMHKASTKLCSKRVIGYKLFQVEKKAAIPQNLHPQQYQMKDVKHVYNEN